jgi:CRISPR-associated protein Csm5
VFDRWNEKTVQDLAERVEDRVPRYFASKAEDAALGGSGANRMRRVAVADSGVVTYSGMKVYLVRTATLVARGGDKLELGWKSQRGSVDAKRVDDSALLFAEMAGPGTAFAGGWHERSEGDRVKLFQASNRYAEGQLARHKDYAQRTGMSRLLAKIEQLEARLAEIRVTNHVCLLSIGWGGGLLGKSAYLNTEDDAYRKILRHMPLYQRAIQTGMPFPKTRRVIFEGNQPASLPGWVMLEVG